MSDDTEELTAYHEAGHAWAALYVGARVQSLSISPDNDDGPERFGDTTILWSRRRFGRKELSEKLAWVALAGPVAEMVYSGKPFHPGTVAEWRQDWKDAFEALEHVADVQRRLASLEQTTIQLYQAFQDDFHWNAISALADHLLAHEIMDEEMIQEAVEPWLAES